MAKIEIDEDQLKALNAAALLVQKLNGDPKSRKSLEAAIKVHHPEVETEDEIAARLAAPHIARIKELEEQLSATNKRIDEDFDNRKKHYEEMETASAFKRLQDAGYTEEGITKIKALMVDRKIGDPEAAAALFDRQNPPPSPETSAWEPAYAETPTGGALTDDEMKLLFTDEDRFADKMIGKVLTEMRRAA